MKLLWTGTDSLVMNNSKGRKWSKKPYWFVYRNAIKLLEFFASANCVNSELIANNIRKAGLQKPIEFIETPLKYKHKLPKQPHDRFTVLYYRPITKDQKFSDWLYGYDIILMVRLHFKNQINFIEVDGSQDLSKIYPITDFLIRCNRHDGNSRMVRECIIQEIDMYYTNTDPSFKDIVESLNKAILNNS